MDNFDYVVDKVLKVINSNIKKKTTPYDATGTVTRIDGNTAWVHFENGVDETPVVKSIDCNKGDKVRIRISGGAAYLSGNETAPPTDDRTAIAARGVADSATMLANNAHTAAENAVESAQEAATAAGEAKTSAGEAKTWANEAKGEAVVANQAATNALRELSTVENVVDTLEWITAHGTMTLTSDVDIDPSHVYFVVDPTGQYVVGGTHYSIVEEPKQAELSTYYELTIDDAVTNYVATHIVMDTEGLWIVPDTNNANRVLIAHGNGNTYTTAGTYIIGTGGAILAKFLANSAVIGENANGSSRTEIGTDGMHIYQRANGSDTTIAHLGYGSGNAETGTAQAPYYTIGIRVSNSTLGNYSMAEGTETTASGYCAHAEGKKTIASGKSAHAEGAPVNYNGVSYSTTASGYGTHAEGDGTTASGSGAHAEGEVTTASGQGSHAEGTETTASGYCAHAEGDETTASGSGAHAEGYGTTASGFYSHAGGYYTKADYDYQTAIGKYNSNKSSNLFEVGNGTATNARNAFEVDSSGNVNIPSGAKYKINGTNLAAADVSALSTSDKYTRSSAGALDWSNQTEGDSKVIMKSALAYWNGMYNGSGSNLSRCTQGQIIGRNQICYANSRVDTFSSGKITIANTSLGVTTGAKPVGIILTPEYGGAVMMKYNYDSSTNTNSIIECYNADGSAYNGAMRYFAVVFQNTWTSV